MIENIDNFNGKMLITGDIHIHRFKQYSDKTTDITSRLQATIDVLNQMYEFAVANGVMCIVVNGDTFEEKDSVECVVNNSFHDWVVKSTRAGICVIINIGNHDMASLNNPLLHLLHTYKELPNVEIIDTPTLLDYKYFGGFCNCLVLPYRNELNDVRKAVKDTVKLIQENPDTYKGNNDPLNLCFYHGTIMGAKITSREFMDANKALFIKDLAGEFFDFIFLSHFHQKQDMAKNAKYVGSPLQHDMSDVDSEKGFFFFDMQLNKLKFIKTTYPTFNRVVIENREDLVKIEAAKLDTNYYDIKIVTPDVTDDDVKAIRKDHHFKVAFDIQYKSQTRLQNVDNKTDISDVISAYVDYNNMNNLDKMLLITKGVEYVRKAKTLNK